MANISLFYCQDIPPVHGDKVAKPLVSQFMGNNVGNIVLETGRGGLFVVENALKSMLAL